MSFLRRIVTPVEAGAGIQDFPGIVVTADTLTGWQPQASLRAWGWWFTIFYDSFLRFHLVKDSLPL